ncbi:E3 ubiquitin-protein ligase [Ancistrocladus abbreviatus]
MGLHSQLNDVSSDSIPLLLVALIATCLNHLRSLLFGFFQSMGLQRLDSDEDALADGLLGPVGSGLAGLIVLSEQLNRNRDFSYEYREEEDEAAAAEADRDEDGSGSGQAPARFCGPDCVVCLCRLRDGQQVRKLDCRHVFHKECFDGWLDHMNFNCPLCRLPLVSDDRVTRTERLVASDVVGWFSIR